MRFARWLALLGSALLLLSAAAPAATHHRRRPPTVVQRVALASKQTGKISSRAFARGRRRVILAEARQALRQVRAAHTCSGLVAIDRLTSDLGTPTTWNRERVPSRTLRAPLGQLSAASLALQRSRTGRRCGAKPAAIRKLAPQVGGSGAPKVQPPNIAPEQGDGLDKGIPAGRYIPPKSIGPTSGLGADLHGPAAEHGNPLGHVAADPFSFFRNSDVGVPPRQASPQEPTTAIDPSSGVAWYTGNTSDGLSTDNGRTWTTFDPSNVLPDSGLSYCCDQLVSYSPQYNVFVWVSQYWCNTGGCFTTDSQGNTVCRSDGAYNRIRIAVASPAALRANATDPGRAWTYWDITPSLIGQPSNAWFDRSDMSVNPWNFNWGVDILCGTGGNLTGRISLAQLAARGTVTLSYTTSAGARTTVQGLGTTTTYFVTTNSLSQERIWSWAPFSGTLFAHDIDHSSVPILNSAIKGSDNSDWYDRYGIFPGEVESATYANNTLYVAQGTGRATCTANCSSQTPTLSQVFSQPAIFISKYDVNSWHNVGERWIWNANLAFGWPALSTDVAGDVGLVFRTAAAGHNAQPVAGFLTPSEQFFYADPEGQPYETGDYYSLRPGRTSRSFVMTAQTVQNDPSGAAMHWFFVEFGLGAAPYVSPPSVHITAPATLSSFTQGATVHYSATVSDPIDGTLPAAAIRWSEDGSPIGTGSAISHVENSVGTHTIVVTATNGDGRSASDSVTIRVSPPPGPLTVAITSPKDGSAFRGPYNQDSSGYCVSVAFTTQSSGGTGPVSYTWTDIRDGAPPQTVAQGASPTLDLCAPGQYNSSSTHDVTVTASDGTHTATSSVRVYILGPFLG